MTTSSTPITEVIDAFAEHIKAEGFIRFGELANYLEARGIRVAARREPGGLTFE